MTSVTEKSPATVYQRIRRTGRTPQVEYGLGQFKIRHRMLDARREELVRKYPDQWVAFTSNGTIVAGYTIDEMVEKLESKGLLRNDAAIKFMATIRRRMIL